MVSVSEVFKTWQEGFTNKDSSKLEKFFTDDFEMVGASGNRSRQQTLEWVAAGGSSTSISEPIEFIYENDDIAVCYHGADTVDTRGNASNSRVQCVGRKRDGKFYEWRVARAGDKT